MAVISERGMNAIRKLGMVPRHPSYPLLTAGGVCV